MKVRDGNQESVHYFADETAVREFSQQNSDLNLHGAPGMDGASVAGADVGGAPEGNGEHATPAAPMSRQQGPRRRARLVELYESPAVQKLIDDLARKELHIDHYSAQDQPLFELLEGVGERTVTQPIFSMPEILERIKEHGRRGVQIKRFKGLGEMNAKELFSTTMDPERRKLLRVNLDDNNALKADEMFTVLMGMSSNRAASSSRTTHSTCATSTCELRRWPLTFPRSTPSRSSA